MTRPRSPARGRILLAATAEFAARGFAATSVQRIARRARVNKALIYYYFASKAELYREVLRELLGPAGTRVRGIAAGRQPPREKIVAFAGAILEVVRESPHLPPIMLRELAEQGTHLDDEILRLLGTLPSSLSEIVREGERAGVFGDTHPVLAYFSMIGTVVFYQASGPIRAQMKRRGIADLPAADAATLVRHVQTVALALVQPGAAPPREEA